MHLFDLVDIADYTTAIDARLIRTQTHPTLPLVIHNYTDTAMYTPGAWDNPAVRACRGLITHTAGDIIARPWAKFFNHGQAEAGTLDMDAPVEVTDKIDGSLGIIYPTTDGSAVATRGSFTSDQATHASIVLRDKYPTFKNTPGYTPLVEIVYPQNRIVCDYRDTDDLILLGGIERETGQALGARAAQALFDWQGPVTETFEYATLAAALAAPPRPGAEGMVVRYTRETQHLVKIKQDDYIALHRIVTGLSERSVWERMMAGDPLTRILDGIPDELHPWVREVHEQITDDTEFTRRHAQREHDRVVASMPDGYDRGTFARAVTSTVPKPLVSHVFTIHDGRDPVPAIMRNLRPSGANKPIHRSEDVA